jgi:hypothetical protein
VQTFTDLLEGELDRGFDGFKTGAIKNKEWSIPYESLTDPTDLGYDRMANVAASGSGGRAYVRVTLPNGPGFSRGEVYQGEADFVGWNVMLAADGFVKFKTEIKGRGACERFSAVPSA